MKLCKDCKYCEPIVTHFLWIASVNYKHAKCKAPGNIDLVTGKGGKFCDLERQYITNCGKEGKLWEAK
jgi:hypothetical protein